VPLTFLRKTKSKTEIEILHPKNPPGLDPGMRPFEVRFRFFGIVNEISKSDFVNSAIRTHAVFQSKILKTKRLGYFLGYGFFLEPPSEIEKSFLFLALLKTNKRKDFLDNTTFKSCVHYSNSMLIEQFFQFYKQVQ
jgi:hypothetical protein